MSQATDAQSTEVLVLGSGCAGSLLGWILARQGVDVVLIDRGRHPRFAIGESSTPLADFLLEQIAERYGLPELAPLARWGSWRKTYPQLRCGKKRGFSYFGHRPYQPFADDQQHSRSLLVGASVSDEVSDTHWMRSDVDEWLCQQAARAGARTFDLTEIDTIERVTNGWRITGRTEGRPQCWTAGWLVDATGNAGIVPRSQNIARYDDELSTRTGSLFGHFTEVQSMTQWLNGAALDTGGDPFDGDDAAQHHVTDDGWMWMLRFDCGITSVGFTRPTQIWQREGIIDRDKPLAWRALLQRFPTLEELMVHSNLVGPRSIGQDPRAADAQLGWIPRISRLWAAAAGERWLALPSTVGVIDPLHSTGLAHALSGVVRAAEILLEPSDAAQRELLARYSWQIVDEVRWIDQLVATCYAALPDFELFMAASTFYFIAAIDCERQWSSTGTLQHGFLGAGRREWRELARSAAKQLTTGLPSQSPESRATFVEQIRREVEPWNSAGLLDPAHKNRYIRSAAQK